MLLADLVSGRPHICGPATTLAEAARAMSEAGHGSLGVVDGRRLVGVITERDLVRAIAAGADLAGEPVHRWMGVDPDLFQADTDVVDAAEWLLESGYRHLPVVDEGELLGIVSVRDLLGAVIEVLARDGNAADRGDSGDELDDDEDDDDYDDGYDDEDYDEEPDDDLDDEQV